MPATIACKACGADLCDDSQLFSASHTHLLITCLPALLAGPPSLDPSTHCINQLLACPACHAPLGLFYIATTAQLAEFTDRFVLNLAAVDWPGFATVRSDTELMATEMTAACEYLRKAEIRVNHLEVCNRLLTSALADLKKQ